MLSPGTAAAGLLVSSAVDAAVDAALSSSVVTVDPAEIESAYTAVYGQGADDSAAVLASADPFEAADPAADPAALAEWDTQAVDEGLAGEWGGAGQPLEEHAEEDDGGYGEDFDDESSLA